MPVRGTQVKCQLKFNMLSVAFAACAVLLSYFAYWCYEKKRRFRCLDHIPSPKGYPVIENALEFGRCPADIYNGLTRLAEKYGPICRVWIGPTKCYLLVTDENFLEFILSSVTHTFKSNDYRLLKPWLSNGLLLSNGSYWQKRRKIITPTFHFKILEEFNGIFASHADILVKRLAAQIGKEPFNIFPFMTDYTLDTICETAMGTKVDAQGQNDNEYVCAVREIAQLIIVRVFSFWKTFDFLYQFSNDYKRHQKCLKIIHDFTRGVIEKRREELLTKDKRAETQTNTDDFGAKKKVAFLDLLLQATIDGKPLTNEDIREEVDTFMFEGHDTSASALAFCCYVLSRHPEVQTKVIQENIELFGGDKQRQYTITDLSNMKYLDAVIKEVMRLYPPVPFISRNILEEDEFNGLRLPKGLMIIVFISGTHRRPELFQDPDKFIPERFLESQTGRNPFSYIPFSAGARNCIGQKFVMNELKTALTKILLNFELLPGEESQNVIPAAELVLKSGNGIHVGVKERISPNV